MSIGERRKTEVQECLLPWPCTGSVADCGVWRWGFGSMFGLRGQDGKVPSVADWIGRRSDALIVGVEARF